MERAAAMLAQFTCATDLVRIPDASLMPHEERPHEVIQAVIALLGRAR
ncbi:MAG: hypothetical protein ACK5KU_03775 [Beutenbergiaceae bacterium]